MPTKKPLFAKYLNDPKNRNNIFLLNDIRLQKGEESMIKSKYHNVEISNLMTREHKPGGVALLVPKGTFVQMHTNGTKEQLLATVKIQGKSVTLATQYVHPRERIDEQLVEETALKCIDSIGIIGGDFNSTHTSYGGHTDSDAGKDLKRVMEDNNFAYIPNEQVTHFARRPGDRDDVLDVLFTNDVGESKITSYGVLESWGSDHLPVFVDLELTVKNEPIMAKITDEDKFKDNQRAQNYIWPPGPLTTRDVDEEIEKFEETLRKCKEDATHIKKIRTNDGVALSVETSALITERRKIERKRRNRNRLTEEEKQRSNWLNREIKRNMDNDKKAQQQRQGSKIIGEQDPRKRWQLLNDIAGRKQREENFKALIRPNGTKTTNMNENVELHADRLQQTCSLEPDPRMDEEWKEEVERQLENHEIFNPSPWQEVEEMEENDARREMITTPTELVEMIKGIKNKGAGGPDQLDHWVIKRLTGNSIIQLTKILNACVILTYFPRRWKLSYTTMILKPGKDGSFSANYRPISLCSVLGKLLERLYLRSFNKFLVSNNLQRERQCGFRKGRSAQESLLKLSEDCMTAFKTKKELIGVFVDLEKAFDRLWHKGLLFKLLEDRAPVHLIKMIASFLTDRYFQIKEKEVTSTERPLEASAPQGGVGSPPIFTYYIKDMPGTDMPTLANMWSDGSSYADDAAEWRAFANLLIAVQEMQRYLKELEDWGSKWRLLPSPTKTEVIVFSRSTRSSKESPKLYLYGQELKVVEKVKFLGTIFDTRLTWQPHITYLTSKAVPRAFQIAKVARCLNGRDPQLVLNLINALITSLYDYASVAFAPMAETHWQQIHNVQMRTLKAAAALPRRTPDRVILDIIDVEPMRTTIMNRAKRRFDNINANNRALLKYQQRHAELAWKRPTNKSPYDTFKPMTEAADCAHCLFNNDHFCVQRLPPTGQIQHGIQSGH